HGSFHDSRRNHLCTHTRITIALSETAQNQKRKRRRVTSDILTTARMDGSATVTQETIVSKLKVRPFHKVNSPLEAPVTRRLPSGVQAIQKIGQRILLVAVFTNLVVTAFIGLSISFNDGGVIIDSLSHNGFPQPLAVKFILQSLLSSSNNFWSMIRSKWFKETAIAFSMLPDVFIVVKFGGGADKFGVVGGGTDMLGRLTAGGGFAN
ncbi:hypothetical protein ALC56_01544, partial [Trachymyrmex septentrionalis]